MKMHSHEKEASIDLRPWYQQNSVLITAIVAFIIFSIPMIPYLDTSQDLWDHIEYAKRIRSFSDVLSPHFLFQLLIIALSKLGLSFEASAIVVVAACYASMAAMIARRLPPVPLVLALPVLVLIASHVFLQTAFSLNFYNGYIVPTTYHNPTQVLSKALAIAVIFAYFSMAFEGRPEGKILLPIGIILSALAKPSFLIAFLPCVCLVELYRARSDIRAASVHLSLIVLPAIAVLAFQYRMAFGGDSNGIGFAPFLVYGSMEDVLTKLPGSLLFPVVTAIALWRRRAITSRLKFVWALYAVGMFISVCFVETGPRLMAGNFAWTGQTVTFLLYVESAITLLLLPWRKVILAWLTFALHVVFGIVWYMAGLVMPLGSFL